MRQVFKPWTVIPCGDGWSFSDAIGLQVKEAYPTAVSAKQALREYKERAGY